MDFKMLKKTTTIAIAGLMSLLPVAALAAPGDYDAGAGFTTFGPGIEGRYEVNESFAVRGGYAGTSLDFDEEFDGEDFEADLDMSATSAWVDYHPFAGAFRVSGGVFFTDIEGELKSGGYDYDGVTGDLKVDFAPENDVMPAIGIGYQKPIYKKFSLSMDMGALFSGGFDVDASNPSGAFTQAEVDDAVGDTFDDLEDLGVVPFAKIGITMNF